MKRIVTIDDATGLVIGTWQGGTEQTLDPVAGRTFVTIAPDDVADYSGKRWTGSAFEVAPVVASRILSRLDFARLFTQAEDIAIDDAATAGDKAIRFFQRRLQLAGTVNLDHQDVDNGLSLLVAKGLLTADRKTSIFAGRSSS